MKSKCIIKGDQKKPNKSFDKFLCLNPQFWGRKWILVDKIHFPSLFILWSKVKKRIKMPQSGLGSMQGICPALCVLRQ